MSHFSLTEKNRQRLEKWLFWNFLFCCTSTNRDKTFLSLSNFHIFSRSEKSWGGQTKRQFFTKNDATGQKKWLFSDFFSSVAHLHVGTKLFCYYQNFISSAIQRNHGGTRKSVTSTTTNGRRRRTTLTMIIARQDSFRILGLIITEAK